MSSHVGRRLTRHSLRLQRRQSIAWTATIVATGFSTVVGYRSAYPTQLQREVLAKSVAGNIGIQALYGVANNIASLGGFTNWRLAWFLAPLLALWGLLASTQLTRGEEETGRRELLLACAITPRRLLISDICSVAISLTACGVLFGAAVAVAGVSAGGAFVLAAAVVAPGYLFVGIGAIAAQLYPDRRHALTAGGTLLGAAFLLRVTADGTTTLGWLRWLTPFGWVENVHVFARIDPVPFLALATTTAVAVVLAVTLVTQRDFATGLVDVHTRSRPEAPWYRGIIRFAIKEERVTVTAWAVGIGAFAFVFGLIAKDVAVFIRGQSNLQATLAQLGVKRFDRPQDFLGLMFTFFTVPIAVFAATQVAGVRREESTSRLDVLVVQPLSRTRWLLTRVGTGVAGVVVLAVAGGGGAWIGAAARDSGIGWRAALGAGANCVPTALFFFGAGLLFFGVLPRVASGAAFGAVVVAYLVVLVGELVNVPKWVLWLSPFDHVAPVPAVPVDATAALVLLAAGAAMTMLGVEAFARRDLAGA